MCVYIYIERFYNKYFMLNIGYILLILGVGLYSLNVLVVS